MSNGRRVCGAVTGLLLLLVGGCQAPARAPEPVSFIPVNGIGYILFNAPIVAQSRDLLIRDVENLVNAGARTIRLGINSPGGELGAAQGIVDYITRTHATRGIDFEAYDVGMVASSATYVFLSAQRRYARANSGFLFHAAGMVSNGAVSAERLREAANNIDEYERAVRGVLKARTRLSDAAIDIYLHRTVILTADDARRDGVIDGIAGFVGPPGGKVIVIAATPPVPRPAPTVTPTPP